MIEISEVPIASIIIGDRHRKELGDIAGLAKSIEKLGLLQPIAITADRRLIFGARRIAACRELDEARRAVKRDV